MGKNGTNVTSHQTLFTIRCLAVPYVHIFGLLGIPFLCCGPSLVHQALTKKTHNKTTTKQNNPPPSKKTNNKTKKKNNNKQKNNSNKQITKTDKTQQTNVALATARAYKIYAFKLVLQRVYFFQNVRKMQLFPMFRNGVKWHKCHIPSNAFYDSLPRGPLCAHIRFAWNSFFVLRTKSSASSTNQKKPITKQQQNKTTPPPPPKKTNNKTNKQQQQTKNNKKNSNKQITKTDKTQQTNVALATARAYKIYVTNVSVFLLFLFIVSSIWGKMVLKPYLGCRGFALIRLFLAVGLLALLFSMAYVFNGCSPKT